MTLAELSPGQLVEWLHESRGGYGYRSWVYAKVVRANRVKVTIEVTQTRAGGRELAEPRAVVKRVLPEKLRPRKG